MPPALRTTAKGLTIGRLEGGGGFGRDLENDLTDIDSMVVDQWAQEPATTTGLTYGYRGGVYDSGAAWVRAAAGTVTLTDNAVNYVEYALVTGAVSANTVGFTYASRPMAKVTVANGAITDHEDWRVFA
jgi:hypothetical protein